jgi:hypothetical protein
VIFDPDIALLNLLEYAKRTADLVVFTDCPPGPEEQKKSTRTSFISIEHQIPPLLEAP